VSFGEALPHTLQLFHDYQIPIRCMHLITKQWAMSVVRTQNWNPSQ